MIPSWLKPNKVGIAFFVILLLLFLFVSFGCHAFFFYLLEFFGILELFGELFGFLDRIPWPLRWYHGLVFSLFIYPVSMILGRSIENRRKMKDGPAGRDVTAKNRQLEWICFIAFLIIVAIPLDLGCFLLSPVYYFRHFTPPPSMGLHRPVLFWIAYGLPIALPIVLMILRWNTAFIIFLTGVVLMERFCAVLAFHTIGEVCSWLYHIVVIWLNAIPMILYAVKFRKTAVAVVLALALLLIPNQLFLGYRFIQLQAEAHAIVEYVYETKAQTGSYPKDLSEYEFKNPHLEKHIQRYKPEDNSFMLTYYVESSDTSHWYDSKNGWHYYPD